MGRAAVNKGTAYLRLKADLWGPLVAYQQAHGLAGPAAAAIRALLNPEEWARHLAESRSRKIDSTA